MEMESCCSCCFLRRGFSMEKLEPRDFFLGVTFDLLPVIVIVVLVGVCGEGETLGAVTTSDESDLSFLLKGTTTSGAFTLLLLYGKIFALRSCKLWSGLFFINQQLTTSFCINTYYINLLNHRFTNKAPLELHMIWVGKINMT